MDEEQLEGGSPTDAGLDIEGQIRSGVEAYIQSQDPQIAVAVVEMLAQQLGIAPDFDPYADQAQASAQPAPAPQAAPAPAAARGMKIYKRGGKIRKFANGGTAGPGPKKPAAKKAATVSTGGQAFFNGPVSAPAPTVAKPLTTTPFINPLIPQSATTNALPGGPRYARQNPNLRPEMNQVNAESNISKALEFKRNLVGQGAVKTSYRPYDQVIDSTLAANQSTDIGVQRVDPLAITQADSVLGTRPAVLANRKRVYRKP